MGLSLLMGTLAPVDPVSADVSISLCGPGCLCIDYSTGSGSYIEVRCDGGSGTGGREGGWTTLPPGNPGEPGGPVPDNPGSYGGNGNPGSPTDPHPCNAVTFPLLPKLEQAVSSARGKLARPKVKAPDGSLQTFPTTCTQLFKNSPLRKSGLELLDPNAPFHAIFRSGENCTLPNGDASPCNGSRAAVTTCCGHSPYIYLCSPFADLPRDDAGLTLIHELLHLAGQREDTTTSTGPGDPPTTNQLNQLVRDACTQPQPIITEP